MKKERKISIKFYLNKALKCKDGKYAMYASIQYMRKNNKVATRRYVSEEEFARRDFKWLAMIYEQKIRENGIRAISEDWKEIKRIFEINQMLKKIPTGYLELELKRRQSGNTNL